jgi:hypothetical protein
MQGLAGWEPGLPLVLACSTGSLPVCASSPEEDKEESAEFPGVLGTPGACTAGSEELLGTAGGSRSSPLAAWLEVSEDRLSTLRAGDGVAEGGSECERREAWRAVQTSKQAAHRGGQGLRPHPTHPAPQSYRRPWKPSQRAQRTAKTWWVSSHKLCPTIRTCPMTSWHICGPHPSFRGAAASTSPPTPQPSYVQIHSKTSARAGR